MPSHQSSLRKHFAFYASDEHYEVLAQLESLLCLNEDFKARKELAHSLEVALSVPLNLRNEFEDLRSSFKKGIASALCKDQGNKLNAIRSDDNSLVQGQITDFQIPACLLQPTSGMARTQSNFIRALLLNSIIFNCEENYSRYAMNIRIFLSKTNLPSDVVCLIPEQISDTNTLEQIIQSFLDLSRVYKDSKTKRFITTFYKLLCLLCPLQNREYVKNSRLVDNNVVLLDDLVRNEDTNLNGNDTLQEREPDDSRSWIRGVQNLVENDYRRLLINEKPHFVNFLVQTISSHQPKERNAAALSMLMYVTGQERDSICDFTFGVDGDITPSGQYRRNVLAPEGAFVQKNELAEQNTHVDHFYLDLPCILKQWILSINPKGLTLIDCIDMSKEEVERNVKKLFSKMRKNPKLRRIRLDKIPVALKLELTLRYRDESLTHLISGKPNHAPPNLSYYIAHNVESLKKSYELTVNKMLCRPALVDESASITSCAEFGSGEFTTGYYPSKTSLKSLAKQAANAVENAKQSSNIFDIHNAYTNYCLLLLFHATGHRPVEDPFPQYSHFNLDNNLLLISDKVSSESQKWRVVALPKLAVEQTRHYYRYLQSLPSKLSVIPEYQRLGNEIARWLKGPEKSLPFFFYLYEKPKPSIISVTKSLMEIHWSSLWQWPANYPRHILATELSKRYGSGDLVKIQLGHNYGHEHPFGARSSVSVLTSIIAISEHINCYLKDFGWAPIKSPIRATTSVFPMEPSHKRPRKLLGYEKRNKLRKEGVESAQMILRRLYSVEFSKTRLNDLSIANVEQLFNRVEEDSDISDAVKSKCFRILRRYLRFLNNRLSKRGKKYAKFIEKEPSPFSESDLRAYKESSGIRSLWFRYLNNQGKSKNIDINRRYAEVTISAAICGGLFRADLLNLMHNLLGQCLFQHRGDLFIDFSQFEQTAKTKFRWYPDTITRSLIFGLVKHSHGKLKVPNKKAFNTCLFDILQELNIDTALPFDNIAKVGKSLGLIELPMAINKYATGALPAACLPLETLVRISIDKAIVSNQKDATEKSHEKLYWLPSIGKFNATKGLISFRKLFGQHKKTISELPPSGKYIKKKHRCKNEILRLLTNSFGEDDNWDMHSTLIGGYAIHMCNEGTKNESDPAYNTVTEYTEYILRLFKNQFKDINVVELTDEYWEHLYLEGLNKTTDKGRKKACIVYHQFHTFLVEKYGFEEIDWSPIYASIGLLHELDSIDADYISESEYSDLIDVLLNSSWIDGKLRDQLALMTILGYRGGLRNGEAHGLLSRDILIGDIIEVIIKENYIRPIKSAAGRRCFALEEKLTEPELLLLKRWEKALEIHKSEDRLTPAMQLRAGEARQVIDRGLATQIIHRCLRLLTGSTTLRFHHFRHSRATDLVYQGFQKAQNSDVIHFNINRYPLHKAAAEIGHADVLTTLTCYAHCFDKLLNEHLPNYEHLLKDYGRAYCLGAAYNSIRKWRQENKEDFSSLTNNKSIVKYIQEPDAKVTPRAPDRIKEILPAASTSLTLLEVEDILLRYAFSPYDLLQFAQSIGTSKRALKHLFNETRQIQRESGYTRYFMNYDNAPNDNIKNSRENCAVKFSIAENKKLRDAIRTFSDKYLISNQTLAELKKLTNLWSRSYHHVNASNLIFTEKECKQLTNLIFQIFGKVNIVIRTELIDQIEPWLKTLSDNISIEYRPIPSANEKIKKLKTASAEIRVQSSGERNLINRMFFILSVYVNQIDAAQVIKNE